MAKGRGESIGKATKPCADKRGGCVLIVVCGPKSVRSMRVKDYIFFTKYSNPRYSAVCSSRKARVRL